MNALGPRASARRDPRTPGSPAPAAGVPPSSRWLLAAVATLLATACDSGPTEPTLESNVTVLAGTDATMTDDAVLVGGAPRIHLGGGPRGMFVQHSISYEYDWPNDKVDAGHQGMIATHAVVAVEGAARLVSVDLLRHGIDIERRLVAGQRE